MVSEYSLDPNPETGTERQLTDLPSNFVIGEFDVAPDGTEIIFEHGQESSSIALFERKVSGAG